jgi:hypothetical protein
MNPNIIVPVTFMIIAAVIPLSIVSIVQFTKYRLKVEQIKADAMVRVEELKLKNQFELEKLIHRDNVSANAVEFSTDDRRVREKI